MNLSSREKRTTRERRIASGSICVRHLHIGGGAREGGGYCHVYHTHAPHPTPPRRPVGCVCSSLPIEQSTPGFSNSRIRALPHVHLRSPGSRPSS